MKRPEIARRPQSSLVWEGNEGKWRIEARRAPGDPLLHVVAQHEDTLIAHADGLPIKTPAECKAWARAQPAALEETANA